MESDPFSVFLPLAIRGFFTAIVFGVPWLVWLLLVRGKGSQQNRSSLRGAIQ
jgi:hypothetical protein